MQEYALSLRQPWATLLVCGVKTIEIRRWQTKQRGRVLIHAAKLPDEREAVKALAERLLVTAKLRELAQCRGGIVGVAEVTECVAYRTAEAFEADYAHHWNARSWFQGPVMYGFTFVNAKILPFRPYPGWMHFFPVDDETPRKAERSPS